MSWGFNLCFIERRIMGNLTSTVLSQYVTHMGEATGAKAFLWVGSSADQEPGVTSWAPVGLL